jgi:hypothetical protein
MGCVLKFEGFESNNELREKLMRRVREFAERVGENYPLRVAVKQVDGMAQSRVELALAKRKVSAVVLRKDPLVATQVAIDALAEILVA